MCIFFQVYFKIGSKTTTVFHASELVNLLCFLKLDHNIFITKFTQEFNDYIFLKRDISPPCCLIPFDKVTISPFMSPNQ